MWAELAEQGTPKQTPGVDRDQIQRLLGKLPMVAVVVVLHRQPKIRVRLKLTAFLELLVAVAATSTVAEARRCTALKATEVVTALLSHG